jgi:micrococcal nuclease
VDLDLGLGLWRRGQSIRLWKLNTPEVRGVEREQGLQVRDFVRGLILDKTVLVRTILDKRGVDSTEKFGRLLGEILLNNSADEIINLNQLLLDNGMAKPLDAGGSALPDAPLAVPTPETGAAPATIACRYCGETRQLDRSIGLVAICPNCLDPSYSLF